MEEAGQGIELECSIFLIIPRAAQSGNETLLIFLFPQKRNVSFYFDLRVNYLYNEVEWPIKTEFAIENLNIYKMQKQTFEHVNLNNRKS